MTTVPTVIRGNSLPPPEPEGDWVTIPQSPIPTGVRNALGEIYRMVEPVDPVSPVDLRVWLDPETMPIANLRLMLREQGFPAGDYIGEVFERRVASRPLLYYRGATPPAC